MRIHYEPKGNGPGGVEEYVRNLRNHFEVAESIYRADVVHTNAMSFVDTVDVFTCHGLFLPQDWGDTQDGANQLIYDNLFRAKKVICVAKWYLSYLRGIGIADAVWIPNAIDPSRFHTGPFEYFLYLGSDNPVKNPDDIVKLSEKVDYPFKISALRISRPNIEFLGYPVERDVVPDLLAHCRAIIMPFEREVCSTVTLEAFASGKPTLGKVGGSQSDLVTHLKTGYLYTDLDDMIRGAHWLMEHAEELEENCLKEAKKYTFEKTIPQIAKVYESVQELPVSVVILAYKNRATLERAISSCGKGVEIIVVDALGEHEDLVPDYCKYITTSNKSIGANRNSGIDLATREFTVFCDGDDYCLDGKMSLYRFFDDDNIIIVFGNGWWGNTTFTEFSKKLHQIEMPNNTIVPPEMLLRGNIIPSGACMFRTKLAQETRFDESLRCGVEDYDFHLRMSEQGRIKYMDRVVYYYNVSNQNSITRSSSPNQRVEEIKYILAKAGRRRGLKKVTHAELGEVDVDDFLNTVGDVSNE